jgi:hypothetical protein
MQQSSFFNHFNLHLEKIIIKNGKSYKISLKEYRVTNLKCIFSFYLLPFLIMLIGLILPNQIQGQPIIDNNTGESHMLPPFLSEDGCYNSNSPITSSAEHNISCKNNSTSNKTDIVCFGGTEEPLNCREVPLTHSSTN